MGHWLYHPESECVYYTEDKEQMERDVGYGVDILSEKGKENTEEDLRRCLIIENASDIDGLLSQYKNS